MKEKYVFIVESDYYKNPILYLRHECCVRTDIPKDIRDFVKNLKTYGPVGYNENKEDE